MGFITDSIKKRFTPYQTICDFSRSVAIITVRYTLGFYPPIKAWRFTESENGLQNTQYYEEKVEYSFTLSPYEVGKLDEILTLQRQAFEVLLEEKRRNHD